MKMDYYNLKLFTEALTDLVQKYNMELDELRDENGTVRLDVDRKRSVNIARKQSVVQWVLKELDHSKIEF